VTNQLESLKQHSVIVADTGDIESIARFRPQDATTNPSLIFKAAQDARYRPIIDAAELRYRSHRGAGTPAHRVVRDGRSAARARAHQDREHLGRDPRC
jgi:transaldolase